MRAGGVAGLLCLSGPARHRPGASLVAGGRAGDRAEPTEHHGGRPNLSRSGRRLAACLLAVSDRPRLPGRRSAMAAPVGRRGGRRRVALAAPPPPPGGDPLRCRVPHSLPVRYRRRPRCGAASTARRGAPLCASARTAGADGGAAGARSGLHFVAGRDLCVPRATAVPRLVLGHDRIGSAPRPVPRHLLPKSVVLRRARRAAALHPTRAPSVRALGAGLCALGCAGGRALERLRRMVICRQVRMGLRVTVDIPTRPFHALAAATPRWATSVGRASGRGVRPSGTVRGQLDSDRRLPHSEHIAAALDSSTACTAIWVGRCR